MMKRYIWINTEFNATHSWPECPIEEVKFLQHEHRHTFRVRVQIEVEHNDRAIEFIVFKNFIDRTLRILYGPGPDYRLGRKSCEDICEDLIGEIHSSPLISMADSDQESPSQCFRKRELVVEVSEDGEVGARVEA